MKKFYLLIICFISISVSAQQITFNKTYGLGNSVLDTGNPIAEVQGSGYILSYGVWQWSNDSSRLKINFIDYNGNIINSKSYGLDGEVYDAYKIIKANNGDFFILVTKRLSLNNNVYSVLYKVNILGDTLWTKTYSSGQLVTWLVNITETKDNGFLMTGLSQDFAGSTYYQSQAYIVKTDSLGNVEWDLLWGNSTDYERGTAIYELADSSIIISGISYLPMIDKNKGLLLKLDKNGGFLDQKTVGTSNDITFNNGILASDGLIYICGEFVISLNPPYNLYGYVTKIDTSLNILWNDTIGYNQSIDVFFGITENSNQQIILTGGTTYLNPNVDYNGWLVAYDTSGNELWERIIFKHNKAEWFNTVIQASDGGYAMCGSVQVFDSSAGSWSQDVWVVKVDSLGCDIDGCPTILTSVEENLYVTANNYLFVYPNPSSGNFNIIYLLPQNKEGKLEVIDITGKSVYEMRLPQWSTLQQINLPDNLGNGIFSAIIRSENSIATKKLILLRE